MFVVDRGNFLEPCDASAPGARPLVQTGTLQAQPLMATTPQYVQYLPQQQQPTSYYAQPQVIQYLPSTSTIPAPQIGKSRFACYPPTISMCVDSGSSLHIVNKEDVLSRVYNLETPVRIRSINDATSADLMVYKQGEIDTKIADRMLCLDQTSLVPHATENLLSVRKLTRQGFAVVLRNDKVSLVMDHEHLITPSEEIFVGRSDGVMWFFDFPIIPADSQTAYALPSRTQQNLQNLGGSVSIDNVGTSLPPPINPNVQKLTPSKITDINCHENLMKYLAGVPQVTISVLKDLEQQDIKSLHSQLGWLWHYRLGHPSYNAMLELKKYLPELHGISIPVSIKDCHACKIAKATRIPHITERRRSLGPLMLWHTDVIGDILPSAYPNLERYILVIVDDFSRFSYVYPMKDKKSVHLGLKEFHDYMTRHCNPFRTQFLRLDNGTEYKTAEVVEFMNQHKILPDNTPTHTSELNGVAERFNRTLQNMTRALLVNAGFPKRLWAYAATYAGLLSNYLPKSACSGQVPFTTLFNRPPPLKYVRRFGCSAYAIAPKGTAGTFSDRAIRKFFVGLTSNASLLLDVSSGKIKSHSDVVFTESQVYGHFYGPFEDTKFKDPIKLKRQPNDYFEPRQSDESEDLNESIAKTYIKSTPPTTQSLVEYKSTSLLPPLKTSVMDYTPDTLRVITGQQVRSDRSVAPTGHKSLWLTTQFHFLESLQSHVQTEYAYNAHLNALVPEDDFDYYYHLSLLVQAAIHEPRSYKEALRSPQSSSWLDGIRLECDAMSKQKVFTLVNRSELPPNTRVIDSTWVFRVKTDKSGNKIFRPRIVARGFKDPNSYTLSEIYAPVIEPADYRAILALSNSLEYSMRHADIGTAFLHGELEKPVYMTIPEGFPDRSERHPAQVWRLDKSLYGLKVSPKRWYEKFRQTIIKLGYQPFWMKPCIFSWKKKTRQVILMLYVDDLLFVGNSCEKIDQTIQDLSSKFTVKDLGSPTTFLGMEFERDLFSKTLFLHHKTYTRHLLRKFNCDNLTPSTTPMLSNDALRKRKAVPDNRCPPSNTLYREKVGALMYLSTSTRPDIAYATNVVSRAQANPSASDMDAVNMIMTYLLGTIDKGLLFTGTTDTIECWVDASLGMNDPDAKSTSGYALYVYGDLVAWRSKKQTHVALSSSEAEYIAASLACRQVTATKALLDFLFQLQILPVIHGDSQTAISLANSLETKSLKHVVKLCYHYIRFEVQAGQVIFDWVEGDKQIADILTKPLAPAKFLPFSDKLVYDPPSQ